LFRKFLIYFGLIFIIAGSNPAYTQTYPGIDNFKKLNLNTKSISDKSAVTNSTLPFAIGTLTFLYLFNPIVLMQNDRIAAGLTKEVSLGFGDFGQERFSIEYSYLFIADNKSILRAAYEHDFLLKSGIKASNILQGTSVFTIGAGYYTNFTDTGYFPEISYGYSVRNNKFLFYPSLKGRYTFVVNGSDIVDFSFGIVLGIANPFSNKKIHNSHVN
jgi:hypothetical protein